MRIWAKLYEHNPVSINEPDIYGQTPIFGTDNDMQMINYYGTMNQSSMYCWEAGIINMINANENGWFDFNKSIVDIGAGLGEYCWLTNFKHAYAFEPNRETYYMLGLNLLGHDKVYDVDVFNCGISDKEEEVDFDGYSVPRSIYKYDNIWTTKEKFYPLDSFNITNIGLIKIDVEGFEIEVIKSGINTIKNNNYPPLLVEIWEEDASAWQEPAYDIRRRQELIDLIEGLGYKIFWYSGDYETHFCIHKSQLQQEN